jgi:hypothetical protein
MTVSAFGPHPNVLSVTAARMAIQGFILFEGDIEYLDRWLFVRRIMDWPPRFAWNCGNPP